MRSFLLVVLWFSTSIVFAQELNCKVVVNADRVQISDRKIFSEMELKFAQFINDRTWTEDEFTRDERIDCNIILTLDPSESVPSTGLWGASVQIISSRPVYNTSYETVVLNFADRDWQFDYVLAQPLQFNINSFTSNITSLLAYYAYTIIAMDYDTFSELGGTRYYQMASQIVSNAQNSNYSGWSQFNSVRNRYWLTENLLSSNFDPLRKALYQYHIKGLDIFGEDPSTARTNILKGLEGVQAANKARPRSIATISFLDAKTDELIQIFKGGSPTQQKLSYDILTKLDPAKTDTFKKIMEK